MPTRLFPNFHWKMEDSNNFLENIGDIDGEQDIARSAYADMLHDVERVA